MDAWDGKSKGTPLGYRIFVFTLRLGGIRPAYLLLHIVVSHYFLFSWRSSRPMYVYFRERLRYSRLKSVISLYRNYYKFGQTILDKIVAIAGIGDCFTFDFDGEHHLEEMVAGGKGGLLLGAHLGNWEIAGFYLKRINTGVHVVMFDAESERIRRYLDRVTGGRKMNIIPIRDDLSHIYQMADALRNNDLVCIHADRFLPGNRTIEKMFLGKPARFPEGVFVTAALMKVPVTMVYAMKESATHYHFYATPPKVYAGAPRNELVQEMADDYVYELEKKIKQYPLHWFNYYDFWEA